jgi:uncharacterized repeat protein (TIGR01451 family)
MHTKVISGVVIAIVLAAAAALAQSTSNGFELISVSSAGVQGNDASGTSAGFTSPVSEYASVSADGCVVAFMSFADNLVPDDTNGVADVFVRDRCAGTTERVSVTSKGREGDDHSGFSPSTGADIGGVGGRFVVFASNASNFAKGDTNQNSDVFIHDRLTRTTELVSRGLDGSPATGDAPVISADGNFVAFRSFSDTLVSDGNPNFFPHIYVFDRVTQAVERVDVDSNEVIGDSQANRVAISGDGRYIAFDTFADNLAPGPGDQQGIDVFIRDRVAGTTEGISTVGDNGGFEGNSFLSSITPDGRFVGFSSADPTFPQADTTGFNTDAFVFDRQTRIVQLVSRSSSGVPGNDESSNPLVAADGSSVVFLSRASNLVANDTNEEFDAFRRDLVSGVTVRIAADDQVPANDVVATDITPDGFIVVLITGAQLVAEQNAGANFFDVYVAELRADVAVTNTDAPDPVAVRANLTYTVTVFNSGPAPASEVTLTDPLPAAATFVSATATQGSCVRTGKGGKDGDLLCTLGTIGTAHSATITIVVRPSSAGVLTNTVTARSGSPDPNPGNNAATATTTVTAK